MACTGNQVSRKLIFRTLKPSRALRGTRPGPLLLPKMPSKHPTLAFIDKCGHMPWLEQPEQTWKIVSDFLAHLPN